MLKPGDIQELMHAKPFRPFRIHMADGSHYDIGSHDHAMITARSVEVGMEPDVEGFPQRLVRCTIGHITRIEELQAA